VWLDRLYDFSVAGVAAEIDLASVDLSHPDVFADGPSHELFARMRAQAPVQWNKSGGAAA